MSSTASVFLTSPSPSPGSALSPGTAYRRSLASKPRSSLSDEDEPIGSRSFDLSAMAGDEEVENDEAEEELGGRTKAPNAGYEARKAAKLKQEEEAKSKKVEGKGTKKENVSKSKKSSSISPPPPTKKKSTNKKKAVAEEEIVEPNEMEIDFPQDDYPQDFVDGQEEEEEDYGPMEVEQIIEDDVGEEALEYTTAGKKEKAAAKRKDLSEASKSNVKSKKVTSDKGIGKGKAKQTSSGLQEIPNGNMPVLEVQKRTTKTKAGTNQETIHREVVERIPSAYQRSENKVNEEGLRRGGRHRIKPLEFWRGERVVYGRSSLPSQPKKRASPTKNGDGDDDDDDDEHEEDEFEADPKRIGGVTMKEVIRVPRAEGEGTFSGMKLAMPKKSGIKNTKKVKRIKRNPDEDGEDEIEYEDMALDPTAATKHPEDDWDAETNTHGVVFDAEQGTELERSEYLG